LMFLKETSNCLLDNWFILFI